MPPVGVNYKEKEESGRQPRQSEKNIDQVGQQEEIQQNSRNSITDRLTRPLNTLVSRFISLTRSGRVKRVASHTEQFPELEHREVIQLTLESLVDGINCIGAMADSISYEEKPEKKKPYQLVSQIIAETARTIFDHPCFAEVDPNDHILIEEGKESINIITIDGEGLQTWPCHQLFQIPEEIVPELDGIISMWSHYLGKRYDIAAFLEREIFEQLEQLKERARPLNRLFGGLIRAFDDAVDLARTAQQQETPAVIEAEDPLPAPVFQKHGIPKPHFPPAFERVHAELEGCQALLLELQQQFEPIVQELLHNIISALQDPQQSLPAQHQFAQAFPVSKNKKEEQLTDTYQKIVPLSLLHLLNPQTFLLSILHHWASTHAEDLHARPERLRDTSIREVLTNMNPGKLLLEVIAQQKKVQGQKDPAKAEELVQKYGKLAELATTALFPKSKDLGRIATAEILCREQLKRPDRPFCFSEHIQHSEVLSGARPTTEDKICRLIIGILKAMGASEGSKAGGITGLFYLLTGHYHEGPRWIKKTPDDQPPLLERAHWFQGIAEKYMKDDPELQTLLRALFGLLQTKTKDEWDGKETKRSIYKLLARQAKNIPIDDQTVQAFVEAYDAPYKKLEMTVGELLDDPEAYQHIDELSSALNSYWYKSLHSTLPILYGMLRTDPRLRGRFAQSFSIENIGLENLVSFLRGWEQKTGQLPLPFLHRDGQVDVFVIKQHRAAPWRDEQA